MDYQTMRQTVIHNNRILAYCSVILVCSILSLPEDYKLDKTNFLNQWFVKLGWFWTLFLVSPLLFVTTKTEDKETVSRAIFRIIISSFLWYTSVNLFQYIDDSTGFDISGHTFLLIFSNLIITSELRLSKLDDELSSSNREDQNNLVNGRSISEVLIIRTSLLLLSVLWDFMLLQTAFYYHTVIQKAIAAVWAFGSWYILHVTFYHNSVKSTVSENRKSSI